MGFENPVVGGTALRIPAIQSPNYSSGSDGWIIKIDGSAEFNNVTIRGGQVVSGTALYYNGTPAAGNLIVSIAAAAGTDAYGNTYPQGIGLEGGSGKITVFDAGGTAVATMDGTNGVKANTAAQYVQMKPQGVLAMKNTAWDNEGLLRVGAGSLSLESPYNNSGIFADQVRLTMIPGSNTGSPAAVVSVSTVASNAATFSVSGALKAGSAQFEVDSTGTAITYANNTFGTYTPTVGNGGTATFTTQTGWYVKIGKMVYVTVYLVVNAAGSGAGIVTVDMPSSVYRTTRQTLTMHCESVGPNGSHIGNGQCVFFTGGSGATADRLRNSSNDGTNRDQNITGADLLAGGIITIEGWYREA